MKGYNLVKRYLVRKNKPRDAANIKEDGAIMMIFDGMTALPLRHKHKRILQEIYHTKLVVPSYLRWSEIAVTYDRMDHPDHIPQLRLTPSWWHYSSAPSGCTRCSWTEEVASTSFTCPPSTAWGSSGLSSARHRPHSTESVLGWRQSHSDKSTYRSLSVMRGISTSKRSPSKSLASRERTTRSSGDWHTRSSLQSPITPLLMVDFSTLSY
jgi:hypothetical protein